MPTITSGGTDGHSMSVRSINFIGRSPVIAIAFSVICVEVSGGRNDSVTVRDAAL